MTAAVAAPAGARHEHPHGPREPRVTARISPTATPAQLRDMAATLLADAAAREARA